MSQNAVPASAGPLWASILSRHSVAVFSVVTVALTFGVALLPLPTLATPSLAVLFPTLVAIGLSGGFKRVQTQLFGAGQWRPSLRLAAYPGWVLPGAVSAVMMLLATWVMVRWMDRRALATAGFAPDQPWRDAPLGLALGLIWL